MNRKQTMLIIITDLVVVNHLLFTIYYVGHYDNHDKKMLVIVPTTSLVEQLYKDFYEYGFDVDNEVHRIYSGKDKVTDKRIIISTWQSIYRLKFDWFRTVWCSLW